MFRLRRSTLAGCKATPHHGGCAFSSTQGSTPSLQSVTVIARSNAEDKKQQAFMRVRE
jgi:hypothetical protein